MVDKKLLDTLACPKCRGKVKPEGMFIICNKCGLAYPVLYEEVPDMLIDDAWKLERAKKNKYKHKIIILP